jgi:riboflavin kinase
MSSTSLTQKDIQKSKQGFILSKTLVIKGKVFSGRGEGAEFIRLSWVTRQIDEKIGFIPYIGTLNVKPTKVGLATKESLKNAKTIEISPIMGFRRGKCLPAYFMQDLKCAIIIPEVENYPEDVIEVIAPVNLRRKFRLKDGDTVQVKIVLE